MPAKTPLKHDRVYKNLKNRILQGIWPLGEQIPTELDLSSEFSCSRSTMGKAIANLVHEGLLERNKGAGTRVVCNSCNDDSNTPPVELDAFAFIYPSERNEGIGRVIKGFQDAAQQKKRRVVMLSSGADFQKEIEFVARLSEFDVRGAVIYPLLATKEDYVSFSQTLLDVKFPVVLAEVSLLGLDRPSVVVDSFHAGYTMTRHLLGRGCKDIGFLANNVRSMSMRDRYMGYRMALEEAGVSIEQNKVLIELGMNPDFDDPLLESVALSRQFLCRYPTVDGVVCGTDFLANGLMQVAAELGIKVPEKLKVVGIDDIASSQSKNISLTTYHIPFETIGKTAFTLLESILSENSNFASEIQVRGSLVVRNSA